MINGGWLARLPLENIVESFVVCRECRTIDCAGNDDQRRPTVGSRPCLVEETWESTDPSGSQVAPSTPSSFVKTVFVSELGKFALHAFDHNMKFEGSMNGVKLYSLLLAESHAYTRGHFTGERYPPVVQGPATRHKVKCATR